MVRGGGDYVVDWTVFSFCGNHDTSLLFAVWLCRRGMGGSGWEWIGGGVREKRWAERNFYRDWGREWGGG